MTDRFPTWAVGLSGSRYQAARNLSTATPTTVIPALEDAHLAGLDRTTILQILETELGRPHDQAVLLARATVRGLDLDRRPSFDVLEPLPHDPEAQTRRPRTYAPAPQAFGFLCARLAANVPETIRGDDALRLAGQIAHSLRIPLPTAATIALPALSPAWAAQIAAGFFVDGYTAPRLEAVA